MLTINRYVIHELVKKAKKSEASTIISKELGTKNEFSKALLEEVHQTYNDSTSLKNTVFLDRNDKVFKNQIENYIGSQKDINFYDFTKKSLQELENDIVSEPFAVGGFYLYADYSLNGNRYLLVVLLRKKDGLNLRLVNGTYVVDPSENLNIDKIAMGFRLNLNIYSNDGDDRNYIGLITNQKDKVSKYFQDWVVAAGVVSNDKNTNSLVTIIKNIPLPYDEKGNELMDRDTFKKEVYEFIDSHPKKTVNLRNLGSHFYGEERGSYLIDFAHEEGVIIDNEFKRSASSLKRLITIKAKVRGIELNVDYDKLNSNEVDVQTKMVIIRNPEIIDQINKQRDSANNR
ncbi:MAG: nucleoid-associated protein [Cyclobacteriaceae bacterium]|tara:strand:+ start:2865 stop:3896 length:1032 start_codon:yes stop_codon:yes gene_type:complete